MQVLRDIYKLAGEEYGMIPNIFAIRAEEALILVDCGTDAKDWETAEESMHYWGIDHLPVTHVLLTHAHGDHAGYAAALQKRGAKIYAGRNAFSVEESNNPLNFYYAYPNNFVPVHPDHYVKDQEQLKIHGLQFTVMEAPGHSLGDVIYQVEMYQKKILFLGDVFHIAEYGAGAWIGDQWFLDSDYDQYMRTLFRLKDLDADVLLSGHMQGALKNSRFILRDAFIKAQEKFDGRWDKKKFLEELKEAQEKRKKKAVIFDLDGVLVSTDRYHYRAWKKLADEMGIRFDEKINQRLRGVSRMESLNIILENAPGRYSEEEKQRLAEQKNEDYKASLMEMTTKDVGTETRKLLKHLKEEGYALAVGSSSKNTALILKQVGLEDAFDAVADGTMIVHSKPNPEIFEKAAELLGTQPETCIVVEDARAGIDAAKEAGMTAVGIGDAAEYSRSDYEIRNLSELEDVIWKIENQEKTVAL